MEQWRGAVLPAMNKTVKGGQSTLHHSGTAASQLEVGWERSASRQIGANEHTIHRSYVIYIVH